MLYSNDDQAITRSSEYSVSISVVVLEESPCPWITKSLNIVNTNSPLNMIKWSINSVTAIVHEVIR